MSRFSHRENEENNCYVTIHIDKNKLEALNEFCYLGSSIQDDPSLKEEI